MRTLVCVVLLLAAVGCKRTTTDQDVFDYNKVFVAPEDRCPTNHCKSVKTIALDDDGNIVAYYQYGWQQATPEIDHGGATIQLP